MFEVLACLLVTLGGIRRAASCAFPGIGASNLIVRALVVRGLMIGAFFIAGPVNTSVLGLANGPGSDPWGGLLHTLCSLKKSL